MSGQTSDPEKELFKTVQSLDTALFDAVNHCDMPKVESYWADDAVFLHDPAPPMVGRRVIVDSIKNNLCGKVQRELVPGTLEVHPLKDYGAVEIGVHRFSILTRKITASSARRSSSMSGNLRTARGTSPRLLAMTIMRRSDGCG